jgi:hypothetical protein
MSSSNYQKISTQENSRVNNRLPNYIKKMVENLQNKEKYDIINNNNNNNNNFNSKNNSQNNTIIPRKAILTKNINTYKPRNANTQRNNIPDKAVLYVIKNVISKIKLDNIGSISYDSYFESNILKLLSYLNEFGINNIKIVAHSALMKKFLNKKIFEGKKIDPKIKKIEKKENMWSIILNDGSICITRHAFTISNLHKEEADKTGSVFEKIGKKRNQFVDTDTKLSLYGILGALDFIDGKINLNNCNNTVFVSILVRTWITAICLYLPTIDTRSTEFKLVVSPFIKEDGITLDNQPLPLYDQIIIIKNFLKFLRNIDISKNKEQIYIQHCDKINKFFDMNGVLVIYGIKKNKDGKIKYVKYEIRYNNQKNCYTSTNIKENYFDTITKISKNQPTKKIFGFKFGYNDKFLDITKLHILPGVRKPTTTFNLNIEPLTKNKISIQKCEDIKIGIIDIDEESKEFTPQEITTFYDTNKSWLKSLNILVVCTQRSLSQGNTKHFQHLLKEVLEEQTNTNFNTKNSNKKNTTQAIPLKSFSAISGSKFGLRTRVYTQGLDNDRLKVDFDSIDFSATSSNEGAILCNIKYDNIDLIRVLNLYADVKNKENYNNNSPNKIKKKYIIEKLSKFRDLDKIYQTGKADKIYLIQNVQSNNIKLIKTTGNELKNEYNKLFSISSSLI